MKFRKWLIGLNVTYDFLPSQDCFYHVLVNILDLFSYWSVQFQNLLLSVSMPKRQYLQIFFWISTVVFVVIIIFLMNFLCQRCSGRYFVKYFFSTLVCICYVCVVASKWWTLLHKRNCIGIINTIMGHSHDTIWIRLYDNSL